jgi:hypothetical protein
MATDDHTDKIAVVIRLIADMIRSMPPVLQCDVLWHLRMHIEQESPALHRRLPSSVRYRTKHYQWSKAQTLLRDNFTCTTPECGSHSNLQVHHEDYWRVGTFDEPKDCVTLCRSCHANQHGKAA